MHIKRFEGTTLAELLEKIRNELGEDALILETRTGKRGRVEVMAARPHAGGDDDARTATPTAPVDRDMARSQVLAHGAAQAYTRLSAAAGESSQEALPNARTVSDPPIANRSRYDESPEETGPMTQRGGSAISRVAQILSRLPKSDPARSNRSDAAGSSQRPASGVSESAEMAGQKPDGWNAGASSSHHEWPGAANSASASDQWRAATNAARAIPDEWRAAADAAKSNLDERRGATFDGQGEWHGNAASADEWDAGASHTNAGPDEWRSAANGAEPDPVDSRGNANGADQNGQQARIDYLGRLVRSEHFSAIPLPLRELYLDLIEAEIDANLVFQILSKMGHAPMPGQFATAPTDQLLGFLRKLVRAGGAVEASDGPRVLAMVGPTGVGKTTTVAKIAGHAAFHLGKRVALVSTDSYRIFGAQHLASYAALMGMKFENAPDTTALKQIVSRHREDCDLLLIDTSGRSPRDPEGIAETERLLAACPDLDVHLVLAANSRVRDQALALERFSILPIRHLIFTKLDETTRRGGLFTVALKAARPVSYLGTGQEVPDDLEQATIAGLTEVIAETLQKETSHA